MFTFKAYDDQGVPHDERRILTQLIRVVEMSPEKDVGVGILTAQNRDVWAEAYDRLAENTQNAASFEAIKKAAVVVCLDGGLADTEPYEVAWPRQVYRGGANAEHAANRWWDKPVQIVVGEDGGSALLLDHTDCDGTVMAGVTKHCYNYASRTGSFEASEDNAEVVPQKTGNGLCVRLSVFGLKQISLENGIPLHPFFKDRVLCSRNIVFSSQANLQCDGSPFADPPLPNVCMVAYNTRPESFVFGISTSKSSPEKNVVKLKDAIERALTELGDCVTPSC
ncbi:carnitine O-acetyltransferase-like [Ixodes scapularis]